MVPVQVMLVLLLVSCKAFRPTHLVRNNGICKSKDLQMGLFDGIFGKKKSASASHILVKNTPTQDSVEFLTTLKAELNKSKNVPQCFADAASKYSTCPSAKNGGYLGKFTQGQMVPAFDRVVFSEPIGIIHGPVKTPFGAHLILIESRSE